MESVLTHHDLIEVANGAIPDGKFDKIWSDRALTPLPPPPDDASWSDNLRYRQHLDDIEKRKAHNETVLAQHRTFWRDKTNLLFEILTASMIRTAPGLRDTLRAKYARGDGTFDGVAAKKYVETWCRVAATKNPQHLFYEQGLAATTSIPVARIFRQRLVCATVHYRLCDHVRGSRRCSRISPPALHRDVFHRGGDDGAR